MIEPEDIDLVEVLNRKGERIPAATFERQQFLPPGKTSDPYLPYLILIPIGLKDAFRHFFPAEAASEGTETKIVENIGSRHAVALYGPPPKLRDVPKEAPPSAAPVVGGEPGVEEPAGPTAPPEVKG